MYILYSLNIQLQYGLLQTATLILKQLHPSKSSLASSFNGYHLSSSLNNFEASVERDGNT